MIVEVIAVGTELLLGQIVNSNAATIGSALAERGMDAHYQQVVGDNLDRVAATIRTAISRSDAIIITGGIGPTQDDLTREALCLATGLEMEFSEEYADFLRSWWADRGRGTMPDSNLQQAEYPSGAEFLANPKGTAPGLVLEHEDTLIFCVPGVPAEMEHLLFVEIVPRLVARAAKSEVLVSRLLRTWGRSESGIAEILDDLYTASTNPSVAFLASAGEIKIRISAKADDIAAAEVLIKPVEAEVRSRLGDSVFGTDDETIEAIVLGLLQERKWRIGVAESMTGGLLTGRLTDLPGSSKFVAGGLVPYDSKIKRALLGIEDITHVVNQETAAAMAISIKALFGVEVGLSVTGSAGPDPMEKPPGTIVIGVSTPEDTRTREIRMVGDRERIRTYGVTTALQLARLALTGKWWQT